MKTIGICVALGTIVIINSGCPKPCIEANYSFAASAQYSPDLDSIKVGDTLLLSSVIPSSLRDQRTGQIISYNNSTGIGSTLAISILPEGDTISNGAISNFNFVPLSGRIYNDNSIPSPDRFQQLIFSESSNNRYSLKIGLVPLKKGHYILGLGDALSNGRNKTRGCEKASFSIEVTNTNQHFYLIQEWVPGDILNDYGKRHGYYFKAY